MIWQLIPVNSGLLGALFGEGAEAPARAKAPPAEEAPAGERKVATAAFGDFDGAFDAQISDEGQKINVQLDRLQTGGRIGPQVDAILRMVCDGRWDALFDREDENGLRVSRQDLLVYLRDWVDDDERGSALAATFPAPCVMVSPPNPFESGFQDENFPYDRGEDRYRAKNARMDSLAELYMVAGVTDAFMAAFGDAMTVYLPRDAKRNVNETDRSRLLDLARIVADPPTQPILYDPEFADRLQKLVVERTFGGMLSMTPSDFGQLVAALGVKVNMNQLSEASPQNPFTDRSSVFRIQATGRAGDVTKLLVAVVRFDKVLPGQVVTTPGQLVHWRED